MLIVRNPPWFATNPFVPAPKTPDSVVIPGEDPESMVRFDTLDSRSPLSQRCHSGRRPGIQGPFPIRSHGRRPGIPAPRFRFRALSFRAKTRNPSFRLFAALSFRAKTRNPWSVSIPWIPAPRFRSVVIPGEDPESMVRFDTLDSRSPLSQRCHSGRRPGIHPWIPAPRFRSVVIPGEDPESILPAIRSVVIPGEDPESILPAIRSVVIPGEDPESILPAIRSVVIPGEDPESILPAIRSVVIPGEDPESMVRSIPWIPALRFRSVVIPGEDPESRVRFDTLDSRSPLSQRCHSGRRPGIQGMYGLSPQCTSFLKIYQ